MQGPELVAVKATEKRYRVLRHEPSGSTLDDAGEGMWPADQFTFRLRNEGAIKIVEPEAAAAAPAAKPLAKAAAKKVIAKSAAKPGPAPAPEFEPLKLPDAERAALPRLEPDLPDTPENRTFGQAGQEV